MKTTALHLDHHYVLVIRAGYVLRSYLLDAEIPGLRHSDVTPGQITLLTFAGSPEAEAAGAAFGIEGGQTEGALHTGVAFETHH